MPRESLQQQVKNKSVVEKMSEQTHKPKMSDSNAEIPKRPSLSTTNSPMTEELRNNEQKLFVEKDEQNNLTDNVNTDQKVDAGGDTNGYRFVKVNV